MDTKFYFINNQFTVYMKTTLWYCGYFLNQLKKKRTEINRFGVNHFLKFESTKSECIKANVKITNVNKIC